MCKTAIFERFLRPWVHPLRCCGLAPLSLDFLSVFEGEPHIVLAVHRGKVHQSAPKGCIEGVHQVGFFEGGKEIFNRCPAGLLTADGLIQGFIPGLGCVEPSSQSVIAFLVFHLVEGNMSIFVYALLDKVGNHRHFAFQFSLFRFEGGKVECSVEGCCENRDNRILLADQLIDRRYHYAG